LYHTLSYSISPTSTGTFVVGAMNESYFVYRKNHREKASIIDTLIEKMEEYAQNLETSVDEKTHALIEEKKKTDQLLYSILPR
jgi:hypothetical protein